MGTVPPSFLWASLILLLLLLLTFTFSTLLLLPPPPLLSRSLLPFLLVLSSLVEFRLHYARSINKSASIFWPDGTAYDLILNYLA